MWTRVSGRRRHALSETITAQDIWADTLWAGPQTPDIAESEAGCPWSFFKIPSFRGNRRWRYLAKARPSVRNRIGFFMTPAACPPSSPEVATQPEGWSWAVVRRLREGQPEEQDHRAHLLAAEPRIRGVEAEGEHAAQEGTSSNREVAAAIEPHGTHRGKSSQVTQFGSAARSDRIVTLRFRAGFVRR